MSKFLFFCTIGLLLPNVTNKMLASEHHTIAKRKSAKNTTRKNMRKKRNEHTVTTNILSPFVLRFLYSPSYRFFTEETRENIDEFKDEGAVILKVARFFPISMGVEGELAFNNMLSLATGGNFSYHGEVSRWEAGHTEQKDAMKNAKFKWDIDYYEFTVDSSLYIKANLFKLGLGGGLTFTNTEIYNSIVENDKKFEQTQKNSYKKVSAHFSLRRDFFSAQGYGVGIGLTTSVYLTDAFGIRVKSEQCLDGKDCETTTRTDKDFEDDKLGIYSAMLIPMIYLVF